MEIYYPFNTDTFDEQWEVFKDYRREQHGFKFKSPISEQAALKRLGQLAKNEAEAIEILHQSMANGWKGFFALKPENKKHSHGELYQAAKQYFAEQGYTT